MWTWSFAVKARSPSCKLLEALAVKGPLANIAGLSWKDGSQRMHNPDRSAEPLDALPLAGLRSH